MATSKRKLTVAAAIFLFFLLVSYAAVHWVIRSEGFRTRARSEIRERTGYEVRFEELRLTPSLGIVASGVGVSRDGQILLEAARVTCFLLPWDYLHGRISRLSLEKPILHVSLSDLFQSSGEKAPAFSIAAFDIEDGSLLLETGRAEPFVLRSIFLTGKNVSLAGETGVQLRAELPVIDGAAALSFSGSIDEKRLDVIVSQDKRASETTAEKTVLEAHVQMKTKGDGGYEVNSAGAFDGFRLGAETIDGRFHSSVEIDSQLDTLRFAADLKMPRFPVKLLTAEAPVSLGTLHAVSLGHYSREQRTLSLTAVKATSDLGSLEGEGTVSFTAAPPALLANTLRIRDVPLAAARPFLPRPLDTLSYSGKLAADLSLSGAYNNPVLKGLAWSDGARIEGERLSFSDVALKIPFERARASIHLKGASLRGKNLLFGRKGETQVKLEFASLTADAVKEEQGAPQMSGRFEVSEGRFSNREESRIGERLAATGRLSYSEREGNPVFKGEVAVNRLDLLWDNFFGDFRGQKPTVEFDGSYHKESGELKFERLGLSLASVGRIDLSGSARHLLAEPFFDAQVKTVDLRPEGFYDFFIRDTFKTSYPALGEIKLTGKSNFALRAQGTANAFMLEGNLRLQQSEIAARSGEWRIGPLELNLPLKIRFPEASKDRPGERAAAGTFSIRQIKTGSTAIPEIGGAIVLWNNALRFPEPVHVRLFGGAGSIESLAWRDVVGAPKEVSLSLKLEDLRLLDLTQSLGWYPFTGELSASIPQVRWTGNSLTSDGVVRLDAFGGRATIRGMEIENPLSPLRSIRMNAALEELNLEQASETFEFGRISGVLAGAIQDLVFTQGQPAEFKADLHTVDRPGVSQWISVEALNKITVLSSGNEAGSIYGGLAGFFDFFRYSKLGFKAALKNDKLTLRGVESKDGKEYLVVGTLLPPTVNIISHTQEIGFSELLRRLERIKKTGAPKSSALP